MQLSSYFANLQIPETDLHFLFHTVRGSIDIVDSKIALAVRPNCQEQPRLDESEIEALKKRGYLTLIDRTEELGRVHAILGVLKRMLRPDLEIRVIVPQAMAGSAVTPQVSVSLDELFALAPELADGRKLPHVRPVVNSSAVEQATMALVMAGALRHGLPVHPETTLPGLKGLGEFLSRENFAALDLITDASSAPTTTEDLEEQSGQLFEFLENQIYIQWTCDITSMTPFQINSLNGLIKTAHQKYPNVLVLVTSAEQSGVAGGESTAPGEGGLDALQVISPENVELFKTICNFIKHSRHVNYSPFFQPPADRLMFDIGKGDIYYESPSTGVLVSGLDEIRRHASTTLTDQTQALNLSDEAGECNSCKYALVCGRNWMGQYGYRHKAECSTALDRRISQILPLLLSNLHALGSGIDQA